jgi:hypothetical protein
MPTTCEGNSNIVRLTPRTLPAGIKKIIRRADMELPYSSYEWAEYLALVDETFIAELAGSARAEAPHSLCARGWDALPYVHWCHRRVGKNCLWIYPWDCGWSIECYCSAQRVSGVLTIEHMPILCPSPLSAIHLAEACYPIPQPPVRWLARNIDISANLLNHSQAALDKTDIPSIVRRML